VKSINSSEDQISSYKKEKKNNFFSKLFVFFKKKKNRINLSKKDDDLDHKLVYSLSPKKIPSFKQLKYSKKVLSSREKKIVNFLLILILLALIVWGIRAYKERLVIYPRVGGEYTEGLLGSPKNINPLYSIARDVDSDIGRLIFSSLFTRDGSGNIINDLVKEYSVSENGLEYEIKIIEGVKWHHGENLTVDDIIFTFSAIKNPEYGSPLRSSFSGVNIEKIDDLTFKFVLSESYAGFLELLNFGILPQELWSEVLPQNAFLNELNIKPVGSGPYKLKSLTKNKSGEIKELSLVSNDEYYKQVPYIKQIILKFFNNYNELIGALNNNQVDGIGYLPHGMKSDLISKNSLNFHQLGLPQITSLFINKDKNSLLESKDFRQMLARLTDKNKISNEIFSGNASPAHGPILPSSPSYNQDVSRIEYDYEVAKEFLDENSWSLLELKIEEIQLIKEIARLQNENKEVINVEEGEGSGDGDSQVVNQDLENKLTELEKISDWEIKKSIVSLFPDQEENLLGYWRFKKSSVSGKDYDFLVLNLTTVDSVDNVMVAEFIKESWEKIGIRTNIKTISSNMVSSEIIKEKNFEVLLLSQVVGSDQDAYAFWHSSQISEVGLNISGYKNKEVDKLLEESRSALKEEDRIEKYKKFQEILNNDFPVIFLYYPTYNYVQNKNIKGFNFSSILNPADRFNSVSDWYVRVKRKIEF
jgi:ABC-type transport system substrate-binding protein